MMRTTDLCTIPTPTSNNRARRMRGEKGNGLPHVREVRFFLRRRVDFELGRRYIVEIMEIDRKRHRTRRFRSLKALYAKVVRGSGSPDYIARGWALGMFVGCFVPMCFQLMVSVPLSFVLRASKVGATLGTLISNPLTVVILYPAQCYVGNRILGGALTYEGICDATRRLVEQRDFAAFSDLGGTLILSFFIGGGLLALIMTPITYFWVYALVVRYRRFRAMRMEARRRQRNVRAAEENGTKQ